MKRQPSILTRTDRGFWRSRQRRTVGKARLLRSMRRVALIVTAHAIIAGLLLFAGVRAFRELTTTSEFGLERIELAGAERASSTEIRRSLVGFIGRNVLDINLHEFDRIVERDPWIERATSKRILPRTIRVELHERVPLALARVGGRGDLAAGSGHMSRAAGPGTTDDLPVLVGLDGLEHQALRVTLRRGVALVQRLAGFDRHWLDGVSELDLSRADRVAVRTVAPGPEILLDPRSVERNIHAYLALRDEITRRVGDVAYVDLRWRDRVTVMPINDPQQTRSN